MTNDEAKRWYTAVDRHHKFDRQLWRDDKTADYSFEVERDSYWSKSASDSTFGDAKTVVVPRAHDPLVCAVRVALEALKTEDVEFIKKVLSNVIIVAKTEYATEDPRSRHVSSLMNYPASIDVKHRLKSMLCEYNSRACDRLECAIAFAITGELGPFRVPDAVHVAKLSALTN